MKRYRPFNVSVVAALAASAVLSTGVTAGAGKIDVPLRLDYGFVRTIIVSQAFATDDGRVELWREPSGCGHLTIWNPRVGAAGGRLTVTTEGEAVWGLSIGGRCRTLISWSGHIETFEDPYIDPGAPIVRFRVSESSIYGPGRRKSLVTSRLWDWIKGYVHPHLATVSVDLKTPVDEVRDLLPHVLPETYAERADITLASVALSRVRVDKRALTVGLTMEAPEAAVSSTPEPPLDPVRVQQWDAFLTFAVKHLVIDAARAELLPALLAILLDSRHEVVTALTTDADAADPVPGLFVAAWQQLAPLVRRLQGDAPGAAALRYLAFLTAGDALLAIEELGPGSGLDLSADGLRRLARIIAPDAAVDPLQYETVVDPDLREGFGFGAPIPLPARSSPPPPLSSLIDWLLPSAHADDAVGPSLEEIGQRLHGWAPTRADLDEYLPLVRIVLRSTAGESFAKRRIDPEYRSAFHTLVFATAWKETCWRQFIRRAGGVVTIESNAGALGIMQVNPRVWRGFYDVGALSTDVIYNARAGAEILGHYLVDYAIRKKEHEQGGTDALVRATYAAYNGGPSHLSRYRKVSTVKSLRAIDAEFWRIYQTVREGDELGVRACYAG